MVYCQSTLYRRERDGNKWKTTPLSWIQIPSCDQGLHDSRRRFYEICLHWTLNLSCRMELVVKVFMVGSSTMNPFLTIIHVLVCWAWQMLVPTATDLSSSSPLFRVLILMGSMLCLEKWSREWTLYVLLRISLLEKTTLLWSSVSSLSVVRSRRRRRRESLHLIIITDIIGIIHIIGTKRKEMRVETVRRNRYLKQKKIKRKKRLLRRSQEK